MLFRSTASRLATSIGAGSTAIRRTPGDDISATRDRGYQGDFVADVDCSASGRPVAIDGDQWSRRQTGTARKRAHHVDQFAHSARCPDLDVEPSRAERIGVRSEEKDRYAHADLRIAIGRAIRSRKSRRKRKTPRWRSERGRRALLDSNLKLRSALPRHRTPKCRRRRPSHGALWTA